MLVLDVDRPVPEPHPGRGICNEWHTLSGSTSGDNIDNQDSLDTAQTSNSTYEDPLKQPTLLEAQSKKNLYINYIHPRSTIQRGERSFLSTTVPASHGHAFPVSAGSRFRIVDLYGQQVVDFMAWTRSTERDNAAVVPSHEANLNEKLSMAYTRFHLSGATPTVGEGLWSNSDKQLLKPTADTCRVHDMTFMSCNPSLYTSLDPPQPRHRSCSMNIYEAMSAWGIKDELEIRATDPFNIFQNTPYYTLKGGLNTSKAGDYVEFEALEDIVCAVSCCPFDVHGFNGGKITDVAVMTEIHDKTLHRAIELQRRIPEQVRRIERLAAQTLNAPARTAERIAKSLPLSK